VCIPCACPHQCADGTETCAPIRPGCGGFGIRNFLTLFLSIEVSKAMLDGQTAAVDGKHDEAAYHAKRVAMLTEQLVEANPYAMQSTAPRPVSPVPL
jgi:hypothetical protein